ncbi:MAG: hypothetical protein ACJA2H_001465, partial [Nitriliruptoraceae bacterium]
MTAQLRTLVVPAVLRHRKAVHEHQCRCAYPQLDTRIEIV